MLKGKYSGKGNKCWKERNHTEGMRVMGGLKSRNDKWW